MKIQYGVGRMTPALAIYTPKKMSSGRQQRSGESDATAPKKRKEILGEHSVTMKRRLKEIPPIVKEFMNANKGFRFANHLYTPRNLRENLRERETSAFVRPRQVTTTATTTAHNGIFAQKIEVVEQFVKNAMLSQSATDVVRVLNEVFLPWHITPRESRLSVLQDAIPLSKKSLMQILYQMDIGEIV